MPLYNRPSEVRFAVWLEELFNNNTLAMFFWGSGNVVDIQKLAASDTYKAMWRSYFGVMCDKVYRSVVIHEYNNKWATVHCES